MKLWMTLGVSAAALVLAAGATVSAQTPEAQVEDRQEYMKQLGGAAGTIGKYYREGEGTLEDVRAAAATLGELAPELENQFPEGTGVGVADSEALPAIWEEPEAFATVVADAQAAMTDLGAVAETADEGELRAAFAMAGRSCGACHEDYREQN
ncbi:MAG: cytochrome c [Alphaproteobacteria bacterium]|jgi:cytochrome c556|nr:cytochrome c [Alphaproteobacteria bacterium]